MARYVTAELLETIQADARKRWGTGMCEVCIGGSIAVALGLKPDDMYPKYDRYPRSASFLHPDYENFIIEFRDLAEITFPIGYSNIGYWNDESTFSEVMQALERAKAKL